MNEEPRRRLGERRRGRLDDEPGAPVGDDLQWAAGVGRRQDGLLGEERLERDHAEVLVDRGVEDAEAACVQIGQLGIRYPAGEARAPVEPARVRKLLEPAA